MKHLVGAQFAAIVGRVQQVAVALAKGVVDLDHDGAQAAVLPVAIPEADRLEGVAQHARIGVQPEFAVGVFHAFAPKQSVEPGHGVVAAVAVVAVKKAQGAAPVVRQRAAAIAVQAAHGQHQEVGRVVEGVGGGPQAFVYDLAEADQRLDGRRGRSHGDS